MKTNDLIGPALDWAVATIEEDYLGTPEIIHDADGTRLAFIVPDGFIEGLGDVVKVEVYSPSTDWHQGGPIIEREWVSVYQVGKSIWKADIAGSFNSGPCPTPLIAAMRCFVASRLGDEVEIPEELR